MSRFAYLRICMGFMVGVIGGIVSLPVAAQVVINEISTTASDRLLRRVVGEYPVLGLTKQWKDAAFDDSQWPQKPAPFGFGDFPGVTLGTDVSADMQNITPSLYLRKSVWMSEAQATSLAGLELQVHFNDGFILFINGREVLRRNLGQPFSYVFRDQPAFNPNNDPPLQTFYLGAAALWLQPGENLIAIQAHNAAVVDVNSSQFLIQPRLCWTGGADIVAAGDSWRIFPGIAEPSGGLIDHGLLSAYPLGNKALRWATPSFDDSAWSSGPGPIGIETSVPADYILGTNLASTRADASSIYIRNAFTMAPGELESLKPLRLNIDYDDGVVIYLNGREVARRNLGASGQPTPHDMTATVNHNANDDNQGSTANADETIIIQGGLNLLKNGVNILAIQIHRVSLQSSDSIIRATLETTGENGRTLVHPTDTARYFVGTQEPVAADALFDPALLDEAPASESDWIELFNTSPSPVSLDGWSLTDNVLDLRKWSFPAGTVIPGNGYLLVMATGLDLGPSSGSSHLHTNFSLSTDGEFLGLIDVGGAVTSGLSPSFPKQDPRYAYAKTPSGTWGYATAATPGGANVGPYLAAAPPAPTFSAAGGFHDAPVSLTLSTAVPNATIRYTLNGSDPGPADAAFASPISLNSNTIVRARVFAPDAQPSRTGTRTYLFNQPAALRSLPAILLGGDASLVFYGPNAWGNTIPDGEGIFAVKGGVYVDRDWQSGGDQTAFHMPKMEGRWTEKPASFEYLPLTGIPFTMDAGLRIAGSAYSRPKYEITAAPLDPFPAEIATQKPSMKLSFRSDYDKAPLKYPLFEGSPVTSFEDLRIRAGHNDVANPFIKDEFVRRIFLATGQQSSVGTFSTVFLNGAYKGYYNLCEQLREGFMQQHHDSDAAWDILKVQEFDSGDPLRWNDMLGYLRNTNLDTVTGYAGVHNHLEVDNFIDYILVNAFAAMWDWPNNNWVASRERTDTGRWRFYVWDAEGGFGAYDRAITYNTFTEDLIISDARWTTSRQLPAIYTLLSDSAEFRLRFADRVQKQMFDNGALVKERMQSIYAPLRDAIAPVIQHTLGEPMDETFYQTWIADDTRRDIFLGQLVAENLWPATFSPVYNQAGGTISSGFELTITNPNTDGTIYYTVDGTDPRLPGGAVAGQAYAGPIIIHENTTVRARVRTAAGEWSPVREADFFIPAVHPEFIPTISANWTEDVNWTTYPLPYPNGAGVTATIAAPPIGDRNVNLTAPVTIGQLEFPQNAATGRNRVRDNPAGTGATLTFSDPAGALIAVAGNGAGYVEFEVLSGVILESPLELKVDNVVGNIEYGALRLRAGWSGPGGITKTGSGIASLTGESKDYTGATLVNQGVLQVTAPAAPLASASITVEPGGQLRLTSAGNPRIYPFVNPIYLSGEGRGEEIPDESGFGRLGALRFEPGSESNHAQLSCPVALSGPADIHVSHATNRMEFAGALSGPHLLTKTGGGTLMLSHDNSSHVGMIHVSAGTLDLTAPLGSPVVLGETGTLSGYGAVGRISGVGHANIGQCLLRTSAINGPALSIVLAQPGPPSYETPSTAVNGMLILGGDEVYPMAVDIHLAGAQMQSGEMRRGVIATPYAVPLAMRLQQATVRIFVPDPLGSHVYEGVTWAPAQTDIRWTTGVETVDFGSGPTTARIVEIRNGGDPVTFAEWQSMWFSDPDDLANPEVSGPNASPLDDGLPNLMRYALGIPEGENGAQYLPSLTKTELVLDFAFRINPTLKDIRYRVLACTSLSDWADASVIFDSTVDPLSGLMEDILTLHLPIDPDTTRMMFYRLQVENQ